MEESTNHFREELDSFRKRERLLQQQLANVQSQNELLEFQLVELTEGRQQLENGEVTNMGNRKVKFCIKKGQYCSIVFFYQLVVRKLTLKGLSRVEGIHIFRDWIYQGLHESY